MAEAGSTRVARAATKTFGMAAREDGRDASRCPRSRTASRSHGSQQNPSRHPPWLAERLDEIGVQLDAASIARLGDYLGHLLVMNRRMNLTRITEPDEAWSRHVLDALTLVPHLAGLAPGARILDVGSGGGVPGIPLAIARPDLRLSLLEATGKKAAFLVAAARHLKLDVEVLAERAEKLASTSLRRSFDVVTARAVASIETLLGWTAPFAKPGGRLLLIKGARAEDELGVARDALRRLSCEHERTVLTPTGRIVVIRVL